MSVHAKLPAKPVFCVESRLRPVLKWAGGKASLLPQLVPLFPRAFERYVEPFVGAGAVFLAVDPGVPALLADANAELVNLYSVIRAHPLALMDALDALAEHYSEAHYYSVRAVCPALPVACAARTIYLNKTGFNGLYRQNRSGAFNVPFGKRVRCPALYDRANLLALSARLANATLLHRDFEEVMEGAGAGDFVYCDPPYEPLNPTSSFNAYKAGGFSRADQTRLREACVRAVGRGAAVAVSNSSAPFIVDLYAGDDLHRVKARRAINSKATARGVIDEVLVRF